MDLFRVQKLLRVGGDLFRALQPRPTLNYTQNNNYECKIGAPEIKFVNRIMDLFRVQKFFRVGGDLFMAQLRVKTVI